MHLFSFHTAEFLDHFWEQFIAEVDASSAIVLELEHRGIISNGDQKAIRQEVNATLAGSEATLAGSECSTGRK